MVCLWICTGSAGYGIAALCAKRAAIVAKSAIIRRMHCIFTAKSTAIQGLRQFTRRRTAARPLKCGTHGRRKAAHMVPHFQVPPRCVCCILFDVYRIYSPPQKLLTMHAYVRIYKPICKIYNVCRHFNIFNL